MTQSRFNKGLFVGGLVGAALVWLNATKKGKAVRDEVLDHAANVYDQVKERIMATDTWTTLSQSKYAAIVQDVVDSYARDRGLGENIRNMVDIIVRKQWRPMKREMKKRRGRSTIGTAIE
ncbi:MAG TPA: YtxH domain-containing protein [Candidatus Kapabacteria bacterium]|nr:YtxH domain-containing protein [Candidatus Kapabacteria bacterium]